MTGLPSGAHTGTASITRRSRFAAKRRQQGLRRQEARWAARSGEVRSSFVDPASFTPPPTGLKEIDTDRR